MRQSLTIITLGLILSGCATHPTVSPVRLEPGETYVGYSLSTENVFPVVYIRKGLSKNWDGGLRLGLPIYGSGVDLSRILFSSDDRTDLINVSYGFNPNHNIDYTYYRMSHKLKIKEKTGKQTRKLRYIGLRGMFISKGISGGRSTRFGILIGGARSVKADSGEALNKFFRFQWEIGYFHDFQSMPIRAVINPASFNKDHPLWEEKYAEFPHVYGSLPSEFSRLTGISVRISFPIGASKTRRVKPKGAEDE